MWIDNTNSIVFNSMKDMVFPARQVIYSIRSGCWL